MSEARYHIVQQTIRKASSWNPPAREKSSSFVPRPLTVQAQQNPHDPLAQRETENEDSNQSIERAARFGHNFANIPILPPATQTPAPVQAKPVTGDHPVSSMEQRPNQTGLPDRLKAGIESLSGFSLDNVKVHYNSDKPAQLQALAYTQGTEIHVAPGQEQHLPHEAWHVVQQAQGRVRPTMQRKDGGAVNDDEGLEHEADVMGARATEGAAQRRAGVASLAHGLVVERNNSSTNRAALLQCKSLERDKLNVVGETHPDVPPQRRDLEASLTRKVLYPDKQLSERKLYWQEYEFTVSDESEQQADPIYALIAWSIFKIKEDYGPNDLIAQYNDPNNTTPENKAKYDGDTPTQQEVLQRIVITATRFQREFEQININLKKGGPGTDQWQHIPRIAQPAVQTAADELEGMKAAFESFVNALPYEPGEALSRDVTRNASEFHRHLERAAAGFKRSGFSSQVEAGWRRSVKMHLAAQSRYNVVGVWKIGESHVTDIRKLANEGQFKLLYNLLSEDEFNRTYGEDLKPPKLNA
jgi:hypothetical protein